MVQINAQLPDVERQDVKLTVDDPDLTFEAVKALAMEKARQTAADPMLLSWHSGKTGDYWPTYECGAGGRDPWVVFAESRGCNLTVDINDGDYVFYYLML